MLMQTYIFMGHNASVRRAFKTEWAKSRKPLHDFPTFDIARIAL